MLSPNYRIYPSLLDKFQRYLDADREFESLWNEDGEGGYKRSLEEISNELEQSLLDSINRVPHEPIEAADKGTAFNALVDYINGAPLPDGVAVQEVEAEDEQGTPLRHYEVGINCFRFLFDGELADKVAIYFADAIPQYRCEAILPTRYGDVLLYGYIDEVCGGSVKDIKTTSRYEFGKYGRGWQRWVYPYCLIAAGEMDNVDAFEYSVVQWKERRGMPTDGAFYREEYTYNHTECVHKLTAMCERFIEWLELHRDQITDTKIYGN